MSERTPFQTKPSREADTYLVRLPDGMRARISAAAKASARSMNNEVVYRLHHSLLEDEIHNEGLTESQAQAEIIKALSLRLRLLEAHCQAVKSDLDAAFLTKWMEQLNEL